MLLFDYLGGVMNQESLVSSTATVAKSATGCGTSYLIPDRNPFFNKKVL